MRPLFLAILGFGFVEQIRQTTADCDIATNLRDAGIEVYELADSGYDAAKDQYGETSIPFQSDIFPTIIAFAASASDVETIITFVNGCNDIDEITIRSGGHQYSGLSSCIGNCLQLDVSKIKTFQILDTNYPNNLTYNENIRNNPILNSLTDRALIKVGAGWDYGSLYLVLSQLGINFIGGTCIDVFVGGNYQSSGHSAWSSGLGSGLDWIKSFDIVLADGSLITVDPGDPNVDDDLIELFWANMGGSPGAFGVVIDYNVEVLFDSNFPNSAVSYTYYLYSKETFQAVLKVYNEIIQDPAFNDSADFGNCITLMGTRFDSAPDSVQQFAASVGNDFIIAIAVHYLGIESGTSLWVNKIYTDYIVGKLRNPAYNPLFTVSIPVDAPVTTSQRNVLFTSGWLYWENGYGNALSAEYFSDDWFFDWAEGIDDMIVAGYYPLAATFVDWGNNFFANDPDNIYTSHPFRDTKIFSDLWNRIIPNDTNTDILKPGAQSMVDDLFQQLATDYNKKWLMYTWGDTDIENVWPEYYNNKKMYDRLRKVKCQVDPDDLFNTPFTVNPLCDDLFNTPAPSEQPTEEISTP